MSIPSVNRKQEVLSWDSDEEEMPKSAPSTSLLIISNQQQPISTTSRAVFESHVTEGFFSIERDRETLQKINRVISSSIDQILQRRQEIDNAISTFYDKAKQVNAYFETFVQVMTLEIQSGQMTPEKMANNRVISDLTKESADRYAGTAKQLMELRKLESEGLFKDYEGVLGFVYQARVKEIELMESRVNLLHKQENHELAAKIAIHNQQLKQEEFTFNRLLKGKEMEATEREKEFRRDLDMRKQKHEEKINWEKVGIDKRKVDLEKAKLEHEKDLDGLKISVERHRIDADERSRLAEATARERMDKERQGIERERISADERARIAEASKPTVVQRSGGGCLIS